MCELISVNDRLPEENIAVLAYDYEYNFYFIGEYCKENDFDYWKDEEYILRKVSYWMPLPEVPKED